MQTIENDQRVNARPARFLRGFTTIGCPDASLPEARALAAEYALDFIELRALGETTDLPQYFARKKSVGENPSGGAPVRVVATGLQLLTAADADIEQFLGFVEVADRLDAPYVRIFGGGEWGEDLSPEQWTHAVAVVGRCREAMAARRSACEMLLETHSAFSSSAMCLRLNEQLGGRPLRLLWDAHHTWRNAGELPSATWEQIGPLVRHLHFSDSRRKPAPAPGHDCVLPGTGEYPVEALQTVLAATRGDGDLGISLEWEKLWHPHLPDLRQALDLFVRQFGASFPL